MTSVIGPGAMPRVEIKVMFYLSDCLGPGFGQTWVARGSHKWQPGGKGAWQGPEAKARIVEEGRGVEPRLRAGDALFFENRESPSPLLRPRQPELPEPKRRGQVAFTAPASTAPTRSARPSSSATLTAGRGRMITTHRTRSSCAR